MLELDERDQTIVSLRFFADCSYQEIADVVDTTAGAVRTALSRALGRLRDRFDPARFGPDSPHKKGDRPYFPFSLGPRRCLGEYFSFLEMKVHLGLLIQRFRMTLESDQEPALDLGINLRTKDSIILRPHLREQD